MRQLRLIFEVAYGAELKASVTASGLRAITVR
jgi:hypothetical protein